MNYYRYLPYTLTLNSPAIITALGGDPNSSSSLPFIPGAAVRGAVAKVLGDPGADEARSRVLHDLVLGGKARYLNAYPSATGRRTLPAPISFRRKKTGMESAGPVAAMDLAAYDGQTSRDEDMSECWPEEQLAPFVEGFLNIGAATPLLIHPKMSARIHHQRDRKKGRAWKDRKGHTHGAIFAFESLDAGQSFQGMIQVRGETEEELGQTESRIKALLGDAILVGRSRKAGYGGMAAVEWGDTLNREVQGSGTERLRPVARDIAQGDSFRLLLTSACIIRNPNTGQIDPEALETGIDRVFGDRVELIRRRWSFELVGGFNRKWRLELPQALAVSAGSVFVLKANQDIPVNDLCQIENEGLGERKEEGYGRLLFLDEPLRKISLKLPDKPPPTSAGNEQPPPLVSEVEARIVQAQIAKKIEEKAAEFARSANTLPSNSLIGRLRVPLRGDPDDAIRALKRWLRDGNDAERLKRPAMDQLKCCLMDGGGHLAAWILEAMERDKVLNWLTKDVLAQRYHIVSEASAKRIPEEKSQEISVKLIDAMLAALAIRNKTKEVGDGQ